MEWFSKQRAARRVRTSPYRIALEDLPSTLEFIWRQSAPHEYPGIPTDAFFFACAAEGLMTFFHLATLGSAPCALPSDAADSVWHAWLRRNPLDLERFCRKHFGEVVPHVEAASLAPSALGATLVACRRLEGIAPEGPGLPRLFGLDARVRMPGGHGYRMRAGEVEYARLSKRGWGLGRARRHPELTMQALFVAGLIDADALASRARRRQAADESMSFAFLDGDYAFAGDGSGAGSGGGGGDGTGGSDGCDGGGSCGSSCGSSCGGGDD
jgi:hypothetical protein